MIRKAWWLVGSIGLLISLITPDEARGQATGSWVGQRVVTKWRTPLKVGRRIVDDGTRSRTYTVRQVRGDWLWLVSDKGNGWVPSGDVVRIDRAVESFTDRIDKDPGGTDSYLKRGLVWSELGDQDKALADLGEAMRLGRKDANIYCLRGIAWFRKGLHDRALADFDEALKLDPRSAVAYENRGIAWSKLLEVDKAIADFDKSITIDPGHAPTYGYRGLAYGARGEPAKALADADEAIRRNPYLAMAYHVRAAVLTYCHDRTYRDPLKALESATRACQLTYWEEPAYLGTLAAAYAEVGDLDKAVEWQERANSLLTGAADRAEGEKRLGVYKDVRAYRAKTPHRAER